MTSPLSPRPGSTEEPMSAIHRWNFQETEDGFRLCRGHHHRSYDCEWEEFVPRSVCDALRAEIAELRAEKDRLDWMESRVDGTGESMSFGGVCYWSISIQRGQYGNSRRLGEGGDLREAIDDAMESESAELARLEAEGIASLAAAVSQERQDDR